MIDPATKVTDFFSLRSSSNSYPFKSLLCPYSRAPYPQNSFLLVVASVTAYHRSFELIIVSSI